VLESQSTKQNTSLRPGGTAEG